MKSKWSNLKDLFLFVIAANIPLASYELFFKIKDIFYWVKYKGSVMQNVDFSFFTLHINTDQDTYQIINYPCIFALFMILIILADLTFPHIVKWFKNQKGQTKSDTKNQFENS